MSEQGVEALPDTWQDIQRAYAIHVEKWERRLDALVADLERQGFGIERNPGRTIVIKLPAAKLAGQQGTGGS